MSKASIYESRTEALIMPIIEEMNFELVDVEYVKEGGTWYLRAYIDKEGGITVNDCEVNLIELLKNRIKLMPTLNTFLLKNVDIEIFLLYNITQTMTFNHTISVFKRLFLCKF